MSLRAIVHLETRIAGQPSGIAYCGAVRGRQEQVFHILGPLGLFKAFIRDPVLTRGSQCETCKTLYEQERKPN